jgi:hypothetical protein
MCLFILLQVTFEQYDGITPHDSVDEIRYDVAKKEADAIRDVTSKDFDCFYSENLLTENFSILYRREMFKRKSISNFLKGIWSKKEDIKSN